ncbi:MAG: PKD domain-containing protein, partial [Bacteroidota bacterium]
WDLPEVSVGDSIQFNDLNPDAVDWRWDFGDGAVGSGKSPKHVFALPGNYEVKLSVENGSCQRTYTRDLAVRAATSLPSNQGTATQWKIYPNPNQGSFSLQMDAPADRYHLTLYNGMGQVIWQRQIQHPGGVHSNSFNEQQLVPGVYHLLVSAGNAPVQRLSFWVQP